MTCDGSAQLRRAARANDLDTLHSLLDEKASPLIATRVRLAILFRRPSVGCCLTRCALFSAQDGFSPLHEAARANAAMAVAVLLAAGTPADYQAGFLPPPAPAWCLSPRQSLTNERQPLPGSAPALRLALRSEALDAASTLIARGADVNLLAHSDGMGADLGHDSCALHEAVCTNTVPVVELLLRAGARIDAKTQPVRELVPPRASHSDEASRASSGARRHFMSLVGRGTQRS